MPKTEVQFQPLTEQSEHELYREQLRHVLLKNPENRSYDDLLVLKGFIMKTEFMQKSLEGIVNPKQMNDLCRNLGLETYTNGETVFNQGDIGDKVFILLSGACDLRVRYRIDLTQGESEIREKFIKTYTEQGSYFGERALQFDEPRSGTVVATDLLSLITVSKNSFVSVIKEAKTGNNNDVALTAEQLGTKETVINVLSKIRDRRTNQELDAVAAYLFRRIPFFQRFTMPQLVELCRVAETVSVWGRSILFKQGSIGQAFYVVLSGTVEVWVNSDSASKVVTTPTHGTRQHKIDITDGLGIKVNQLVSGEIFGERALENEDSMRMASIVTCEGNTELIIISREDYHNLVYVMMHADSMKRLSLLRRTELFRTTDVQHLKSLSRFMEPRSYQLNEAIYLEGSKALEIIIIDSGECRVQREIQADYYAKEVEVLSEGYLKPTTHQDGIYKGQNHLEAPFHEDPFHIKHPESKVRHPGWKGSDTQTGLLTLMPPTLKPAPTHSKTRPFDLGRIAPHSVLATYVTSGSLADDITHPDSVYASTLVSAYTIGKHDFFNHLPKDTRSAVEKIIADYRPPELTSLWQNHPKKVDEALWKKERAWAVFKAGMAKGNSVNLLDAYRRLGSVHISQSSIDLAPTGTHRANLLVNGDWGLRRTMSGTLEPLDLHSSGMQMQIRGDDSPAHRVDGVGGAVGGSLVDSVISHLIRSRLAHARTAERPKPIEPRHSVRHDMEEEVENTAQMLSGAPDHGARAFSLIQMHRESSNNSGGGLLDGPKRNVRCYMRLCGSMDNSMAAKNLADMQMENIYLTLFRSNPLRERELLLNWQSFKGYDSMPLSDTDHFLIFCRGAPIQYASFSPSKSVFNCPFPAICKQQGQRYACVLMNKLSAPAPAKRYTQKDTHTDSLDTHDRDSDSDSDDSPRYSAEELRRSLASGQSLRGRTLSTESDSKSGSSSGAFSGGTGGAAGTGGGTGGAGSEEATSEYLLEFSVLSEVLLTCASRLDCLKFAIARFGTLTSSLDTTLEQILDSHSQLLGGNVKDVKIYIKPMAGRLDRVLSLLHAGKRVCVVPLFNWVLVNEATTKTLDFTSGFDEAAQVRMFGEENMEQSRLTAVPVGRYDMSAVVGASSAVDEGVDTTDVLFKSFSEVGLLHSVHVDNHRRPDHSEQLLVNSKSLSILERDFASRELALTIHHTDLPRSHVSVSSASSLDQGVGGSYTDSGLMRLPSESGSTFFGTSESRVPLESKLAALRDNAQIFMKVSASNDKLCEYEHFAQLTAASTGAFKGKISKKEKAGTLGKHTAKTKELIAERMNVIESLQKLKYQKLTLEDVTSSYDRGQGKKGIRTSHTPHTPHTSHAAKRKGNVSVSVGMRLSDSIQVLSDSLASKLNP